MLRDFSEGISRHLLQAFPPTHGYSRVEFSRDPMPPLVAGFLGQMLQSRLDLEVERLQELRSPWFDYDHPNVQNAQSTLITMLGEHARIPKDEWPRLLKEAVNLVASYLFNPVETLVHFIYDENEGAIGTADIFKGFSFFGAYPYLREIAHAYFQQKGVREIDRERFETILTHSDQQLTQDYDAVDWIRLLGPLYTLASVDPANTDRSLPVDLLDTFFNAKEAGHIRIKLREAVEGRDHDRLTEADLQALLASPLDQPAVDLEEEEKIEIPAPAPPEPVIPKPAPVPSRRIEAAPEDFAPARPEPAPARTAPPRQAPAAPARPVAPPQQAPASQPPPASEPPKTVPLWQQYQRKPQAPAPAAAQRPAPAPAPAPPPARPAPPPPVSRPQPAQPAQPSGSRSTPLWMQFRKPQPEQAAPAKPASADLTPLELQVLGTNGPINRDLFVSALFSGSTADYERTLRQIQTATSWTQASRIIAQEVFKKNRVDIYSEPAVLFTDAVEEQFR